MPSIKIAPHAMLTLVRSEIWNITIPNRGQLQRKVREILPWERTFEWYIWLSIWRRAGKKYGYTFILNLWLIVYPDGQGLRRNMMGKFMKRRSGKQICEWTFLSSPTSEDISVLYDWDNQQLWWNVIIIR